jgi:hypothetical protein
MHDSERAMLEEEHATGATPQKFTNPAVAQEGLARLSQTADFEE